MGGDLPLQANLDQPLKSGQSLERVQIRVLPQLLLVIPIPGLDRFLQRVQRLVCLARQGFQTSPPEVEAMRLFREVGKFAVDQVERLGVPFIVIKLSGLVQEF